MQLHIRPVFPWQQMNDVPKITYYIETWLVYLFIELKFEFNKLMKSSDGKKMRCLHFFYLYVYYIPGADSWYHHLSCAEGSTIVYYVQGFSVIWCNISHHKAGALELSTQSCVTTQIRQDCTTLSWVLGYKEIS